MRTLIVSNLVTLDGYYEGKGRSLDAIFEYFHPEYRNDQQYALLGKCGGRPCRYPHPA
jgi:hypothetical protein